MGALILNFEVSSSSLFFWTKCFCSFIFALLIAVVAVSVIGVSLFGNQYPDYFGDFTASFMTLFRIAGSQSTNTKYSNWKRSSMPVISSALTRKQMHISSTKVNVWYSLQAGTRGQMEMACRTTGELWPLIIFVSFYTKISEQKYAELSWSYLCRYLSLFYVAYVMLVCWVMLNITIVVRKWHSREYDTSLALKWYLAIFELWFRIENLRDLHRFGTLSIPLHTFL